VKPDRATATATRGLSFNPEFVGAMLGQAKAVWKDSPVQALLKETLALSRHASWMWARNVRKDRTGTNVFLLLLLPPTAMLARVAIAMKEFVVV
jgi:hypothetical protein